MFHICTYIIFFSPRIQSWMDLLAATAIGCRGCSVYYASVFAILFYQKPHFLEFFTFFYIGKQQQQAL